MSRIKPLLILGFCLACLFANSPDVYGQSKSKKRIELEKKKKRLNKQISYKKKLLGNTKKDRIASLNKLFLINKQINSRLELIATIKAEISVINYQIHIANQEVISLQMELEALKEEYAKMVYYTYKNQDEYSKLMFIFSADDFEQAYSRLKYLQQFGDYRKKQAELIIAKKERLMEKVAFLNEIKLEKRYLLTGEKREKSQLDEEKKTKEKMVSKLQEKESELKKEIAKKRKQAQAFQRAIRRVIEEEIRKAQEEAEKSGKTKTGKIALAPEVLKLSKSFATNKSKLPWPLEKGVLVGHWGRGPHPVIPNLEINNNGVDFKTNKGALARAVFNGEVKAIVTMPGAGKFVIIRHGEYLTIYSNLKEVYVMVGDEVKAKQKIASVLYSQKDSETVLHFELWKGQEILNPELWLYKLH